MAKIMLVEDDPMIAEIYQKKFESSGFEVVNATTGKEVLKLAKEEKFDLILLDLVLPEISGIDVLKKLKKSEDYGNDLKIIVFSNLDKIEHEKEAKENGADGFISKAEFSPSKLVIEIQRLLKEYDEQRKNRDRLEGKITDNGNGNKKILFIEDEEIFLEMFGKKLEDEGYDVDYAKNGAWAAKLAGENKYDLVITDMVMPAVDGEEIIRRIQNDKENKDVPIIVISASLTDEEAEVIKKMKVADFFEKTRIVPSDLSARVDELLK